MHCDKFDKQKESALSGIDLSRKGSVDSSIVELVEFINKQNNYFTTSSCSGRIILFQNHTHNELQAVKKKGCHWLFTSHDCIKTNALVASLDSITGEAVFKFEPFILHVQCRTLDDAQKLHSVAIASGLRNSGISIGGKGKIITAIRSTHMLEVPLSCNGEILVSDKYLNFLVDNANNKMNENSHRIDRFFQNFSKMTQSRASEHEATLNESTTADNHTQKRRQKHSNRESDNREQKIADTDTFSVGIVDLISVRVHKLQSEETPTSDVPTSNPICSEDDVVSYEDTIAECFFLTDDT